LSEKLVLGSSTHVEKYYLVSNVIFLHFLLICTGSVNSCIS
jgi:hypothetical protein